VSLYAIDYSVLLVLLLIIGKNCFSLVMSIHRQNSLMLSHIISFFVEYSCCNLTFLSSPILLFFIMFTWILFNYRRTYSCGDCVPLLCLSFPVYLLPLWLIFNFISFHGLPKCEFVPALVFSSRLR
jgi:hypothetical protein